MCIVFLKQINVKLPERSVLERCWDNNPDGAGFAIARGEHVEGYKGFMEFPAFYKAAKRLITEDVTAIVHFRMATHGRMDGSATHPFPVSNSVSELRKTHWKCDIGAAHNGIMGGYGTIPEYEIVRRLNDSIELFSAAGTQEIMKNTIGRSIIS